MDGRDRGGIARTPFHPGDVKGRRFLIGAEGLADRARASWSTQRRGPRWSRKGVRETKETVGGFSCAMSIETGGGRVAKGGGPAAPGVKIEIGGCTRKDRRFQKGEKHPPPQSRAEV